MFNPDRLEALPTLARMEVREDRAAFLYLQGVPGYDFLPPLAPAGLVPLPTSGAVLLDNLADPRRAYRVPAHLCAAVRQALHLRRVKA